MPNYVTHKIELDKAHAETRIRSLMDLCYKDLANEISGGDNEPAQIYIHIVLRPCWVHIILHSRYPAIVAGQHA